MIFEIVEILSTIVYYIFLFLPIIKYMAATFFLILGIRMIPTNLRVKNNFQENKKKRYSNLPVAIVFIIFAFGIYFDFILIYISYIAELLPPGLCFDILYLNNIVEFRNMVIPFTPEWNSLSKEIQFALIIIGLISMIEFTIFFFGFSLIIIRGHNGIKEGSAMIFESVLILFLVGISPGVTLMLIC